MNVTEGVVLTLGFIGAVVTANAAAKMAANNGCTDNQQMAAGMLGCGLAVAVLPAAAMAGGVVVVNEAIKGFPEVKAVANDFRNEVQSRWAKAQAKRVALHSVA
jgi:NADH:ubiquinone oxidoreductase subunit 6 (subunit J)